MSEDGIQGTLLSMSRYRVRRINNGPRNFFRGRLYDVEATPTGAAIPAFRVREHAPEWIMSENDPLPASAREPKSPSDEAMSLVQRADRARWKGGFGGFKEGAWVSSIPGRPDQAWPVEHAAQRRPLMDAQWVAAWHADLVDEQLRTSVYAMIGSGDAASGLTTLARALREGNRDVPRRYAFALERVGKAHGVDAGILEQVYERVPADDQAWAWAHTLGLPKVRQRWLREETGDERWFMEVECTPPGQQWPEWTRRLKKSSELVISLIGAEFQNDLLNKVFREHDGGLYKWQSLFREDMI